MTTPANPPEICQLVVQVKGEVISSNLEEFRQAILKRLDAIPTLLQSDDDFAEATSHAKLLKVSEDRIVKAKAEALQQAEQLHVLFGALDNVSAEIRDKRLVLEKLVNARKEELKQERLAQALERLGRLPLDLTLARNRMLPRLENAIKGKKSMDGIEKALTAEVNQIAHEVTASRSLLNRFEAEHGNSLTMDRRSLELWAADKLEIELQRRSELQRAEQARQAAQAEAAAARAQAQAAAKAAEQQAVAAKAASLAEAPAKALQPPPKAPAPVVAAPMPSSATKPAVETPEAEWQRFNQAVAAVFAQLKPQREALRHVDNIARARIFASAVANAWQQANAPTTTTREAAA